MTSYYAIVHTLVYTTKYVSFSLNRSYSNDYSVLSIVESYYKIDTPDEDKGQSVVNYTTDTKDNNLILDKLTPKIMSFNKVATKANTATFLIYSSTQSTITYTYSLYGSAKPTSISEI